ncbi:MAG: hypothetical protein WHX53_00370, partial [Anaerolineae bacterium]
MTTTESSLLLRRAGIADPRRLVGLIRRTIAFLDLDLSGLVVLTEAASGPYVVTPIIAALAGAARVIALTAASRYGSVEAVVAETHALADLCGVGVQVADASAAARGDENLRSNGFSRSGQPGATKVATTKERILRTDVHAAAGATTDENAHRTRAFRRLLSSRGQPAEASSPDRQEAIFGTGSVEVYTVRRLELFAAADIITNLGFVRPIDAAAVAAMKPTAVVPLMCEGWEIRPGDVDLEACRARGIPVIATNEDYPGLEVFAYSGWLALKMLFDAQIEVHKSRLAVVSGDKFG